MNKLFTFLFIAFFSASLPLIFTIKAKDLIQPNIGFDTPDEYGRTPLWWAAEGNSALTMLDLLKKGAKIEGYNKNCRPLMVAACDGNIEAVKILLEYKADPNAQDEDGNTALHNAARGELWIYPSHNSKYKKINPVKLEDYKKVIKLLMDHGASNDIKNNNGQIPSQLARKQQQEFYPELTEFPLADYIEQLVSSKKSSQ